MAAILPRSQSQAHHNKAGKDCQPLFWRTPLSRPLRREIGPKLSGTRPNVTNAAHSKQAKSKMCAKRLASPNAEATT